MGYRLSKIYTKTGDNGTTALSDNIRIEKCAPIVETIGQIDELNAAIGTIVAFSNNIEINNQLQSIQHHLFNIGGELSFPQFSQLTDNTITTLETQIDQWNDTLPPLKEFILPGGSKCAAFSHQARTTARKAERYYVALIQDKSKHNNPLILSFLNRLSDYLFVLARFFNQLDQHDEVLWKSHRTQENL